MASRMPLSFAFALFSTIVFLTFSTSMATATTKVADIRRSNTEEDVAKDLAAYVANLSNTYIKETNKFTIAVAGGSLIQTLRKLLEEPYLHSVNWSKWHVFWADERYVSKTNPESNYKLAYDGFLSRVPIPSSNIHSVNTTLKTVEEAADDYKAQIITLMDNKIVDSANNGFPKLDLILMGMGIDGHVASLFPGSTLLQEKHRWIVAVNDAPGILKKRVTVTFPTINAAANVGFVITASPFPAVIGEQLADKVQMGIQGRGGGGGGKNQDYLLPIQLVSPQKQLIWFLDKPTAAKV